MPVLSEADSKRLLAQYGVPFADERVVESAQDALAAAEALGFPVAVKLNGDTIAHKTERGLVRLNLRDAVAVVNAASELLAAATPDDGVVTLLVASMVRGARELIAGLADDPQFGATVMLGVGGVLAEAIADVVFRLVPLSEIDALEMIDELASPRFLGPFRGEPAVDRDALVQVALALSRVAEADSNVRTVDLNPLIVVDGRPVAVDALVELRA
ncbi:MAG: acetate--CoA ligase family protein [Acidimicrobiales bacterium]